MMHLTENDSLKVIVNASCKYILDEQSDGRLKITSTEMAYFFAPLNYLASHSLFQILARPAGNISGTWVNLDRNGGRCC